MWKIDFFKKSTMRSTGAAALLKEITAQKACPSCVVITCPDRVRRDRALAYLLDHFAGPSLRPQTFSFAEQGRRDITPFLAEAAAPSLFDPQRFALVRSIESAKAADLEPISAFMAKKHPGTHLLLVGSALPNSPNFKKAIDKNATLIAFEELKGAELRRWAERELRHQEIPNASDDILELIISLASEDPDGVTRLAEKLTLFLDGAPPTTEAICALSPGRSHASDFELADQLLLGEQGKTEALLQQLLSQGSSPFMLLGLLTKTLTNLYRMRYMLDRGSQQQDIRTELGLSPWLFSKYLPTAKRICLEKLQRTLDAMLVADFKLKDRSLGPDALLSSIAYEASRNI